ncbi:hypothetical protein BU14_0150s0003 [Porphyra umbilicalis]|uniref:Uncharacterized protein n=1 Tax=Porphyra umbilicalis TaxID=2786 RepID=A0A1X6P913_PORUM|nr:hypothetical protein BU14_0150s0003 [Porphyra umbilicalis]|eukprot:OSX77391.1 hypothetical protein BU14_0150s0003 [Porphyra umbilicalis]
MAAPRTPPRLDVRASSAADNDSSDALLTGAKRTPLQVPVSVSCRCSTAPSPTVRVVGAASAPRAAASRIAVTVTPDRTVGRPPYAPRSASATTAVHASMGRPERLTAKRWRHAPAATCLPVVLMAFGRPACCDNASQAPRSLCRSPAGVGATPSARTAAAVARRAAGASGLTAPHPAVLATSGSVHCRPWIADEPPSVVPVRSWKERLPRYVPRADAQAVVRDGVAHATVWLRGGPHEPLVGGVAGASALEGDELRSGERRAEAGGEGAPGRAAADKDKAEGGGRCGEGE